MFKGFESYLRLLSNISQVEPTYLLIIMKPNKFCLLLIRNLNAAPMLQSRCMMVQFVAIKRVGTNIWDQSLEHDDDDDDDDQL